MNYNCTICGSSYQNYNEDCMCINCWYSAPLKQRCCEDCFEPILSSKSFDICNECQIKRTEVSSCIICSFPCLRFKNVFVCEGECNRIRCESNAARIVVPLSDWVLKPYQGTSSDIQHLFENAMTEWLGIGFWFDIKEISELTGCDANVLHNVLSERGVSSDSIRFANSDTWTLKHEVLAPVLHSYLKIKFGETFRMLKTKYQ